jgi:peptidylprolyl isomerase
MTAVRGLDTVRPMSRRLLALLVVCVCLVTGCGSDGIDVDTAATGPGTSSTSAAGALPTVSGAFGKEATIALPSPTPTGFSATVLTAGTGRAVAKGDLLIAHYLGETWRDGRIFDQSYDRGEPATFPIGVGQVVPGWDEGLVGKTVGSRVLLVLPPDKGYGSEGNVAAGITGKDTLVFVVDIVDAIASNAAASGRAVLPSLNLPAVSIVDGAPTITIPRGVPAPTTLISEPLIEGTGRRVVIGQTLVVQYVGAIYKNGRVFDSTWKRGQPFTFRYGGGQVIRGWDLELENVPVGSRMLLLVPPGDGYGSEGNPDAGITGDDVLVFVIDVLAAV